MESYVPRLADRVIEKALSAFGGVLIEGPKFCGKTTTSKQFANSVAYLQDPDMRSEYEQMVKVKPSMILEGAKPRLLDEWQDFPALWDSVRMDIDNRNEDGLYILTGSVTVDWSKARHTGAGRITRVWMGTMSLFEMGLSSGAVRLTDMFANADVQGISSVSVEDMAEIVVRGGWPKSLGKSFEAAREGVKGYCKSIASSTIFDGTVLDEDILAQLIRSLSRNTATSVSDSTLIRDICDKDGSSMHINTLRYYETVLRNNFVIDDLKAWSPKMRSKTVVRVSDTRYFCDPAIAAYFLKASPANLLDDLNKFGYLFESLVIRDLRAYASAIGGEVFHYRDSYGMEVDAVVCLDDGRWGAIEVKMGQGYIEDASKNLRIFAERVDEASMGRPSFLAVVTCTMYAYRREDGVYVVPLACLRD